MSARSSIRRAGRVGLAIASVLVLVVTILGAGVSVVMNQLQGNITAVDVAADLGLPTESEGSSPAINEVNEETGTYEPLTVLLMGSDTRAGKGNRGWGSVAEFGSTERSDTAIVMHISGDRKSAIGVSIPRDTMITLPTCRKDGKKVGGYRARFNQAIEVGGPACTIKAINEMSGLDIQNFMLVDFGGFKRIVDAIGGVEICLAQAVDDPLSGLDLPKGKHTVTGEEALAFVRARKTLGDGSDTSRIRRQQAFISSLMRKVLSSGVLLNPTSLLPLLDAGTKSLTADKELADINTLKDLAVSMKDLRPSNITFTTLPWVSNGDGATVSMNAKKAAPLWAAMANDTPWPPAGEGEGTQQPLLRTEPENIRVNVLNGTTTPGLAKKVARQLKKQGFVVGEIGNADTTDFATTTVLYDPRWDVSAKTLIYSAQAGASETVRKQGATMTLIVGADWAGALPVTIDDLAGDNTANVNTADESFCAS